MLERDFLTSRLISGEYSLLFMLLCLFGTIFRPLIEKFLRICTILVSRIMEVDLLNEAHQILIELVKLIEEKYGRDKITPNLHLSLHLCEYAIDFGPLYAFGCFSFERMNGILGKFTFFFCDFYI